MDQAKRHGHWNLFSYREIRQTGQSQLAGNPDGFAFDLILIDASGTIGVDEVGARYLRSQSFCNWIVRLGSPAPPNPDKGCSGGDSEEGDKV